MQKLLHFQVIDNPTNDFLSISREHYIPETGTGYPPKPQVPAINNYLKSLEEIEAEFRTAKQSGHPTPLNESMVPDTPCNEELIISVNSFSLTFPEYMEENY